MHGVTVEKRNITKLFRRKHEKMITESQKKATYKYIKNNYASLTIKYPKAKAERLRLVAAANGDSVRSIILNAINEYLAAHDQGGSELEN